MAQESHITAISSPMVMEGNAGTTNMTFVVTAQCDLIVNAEVSWQLNDGTATTADMDYIDVTPGNPAPGIFVVCAGGQNGLQMYNQVAQIVGDTNFEPDETLEFQLSNPSVGPPSLFLDVTTATGTILNDDPEIVDVDIALTSGESIDPVIAGSGMNNLTQTITATNNGPGDATAIEIDFTRMVPAGVTINTPTANAGSIVGTTWTIPSLGSGASVMLSQTYTVGATAATAMNAITLSGSVTTVGPNEQDTNPGNDSTSISTSITRQADIALSSMESVDPVIAGSGANNLVHTITATNNGPSQASGVAVSATITFPGNVSLNSVVPSAGSWSNTNPGTWTIGTLDSGASRTLTISFTATASAAVGTNVISSSANVSAANETDPAGGNNSTQVQTSVARQIDLTLTKTDDPDPVVAGLEIGGLDYLVTVTNNGPSDGDGVVINDLSAALAPDVTLFSSTPSAGMYDGSNWVVDLPAGATETLLLTFTVGPLAPIGPDAISNFASVTGSGGGETIINGGDDFDNEPTTVIPTTATWRVDKDFLDDNPAAVTMSLSCTSGTVVTPPVQVSEGNPMSLTVEGFLQGPFGSTTCTVTESDLPPEYFQVSATEDCQIVGVEHDAQYLGCVFTNAPIKATFHVTKDFDDDNPANVRVAIECNTGLPLEQEAVISEFGDPFDHVDFVVTSFTVGTLDCDVFEDPVPTGYEASYAASDNPDALYADLFDDENGCHYEGIQTGTYDCEVTDTLQTVDVTVNKQWVDENPEFQNPLWVNITLRCENGEVINGYACGSDACIDEFIDPANPGEFQVYPNWDGSTVCSVSEEPEVGVLQDVDDCAAIELAPGVDGECTIVNTRLYAGIPTLSQYGLAVLALLMLGMGAVAFRRFM